MTHDNGAEAIRREIAERLGLRLTCKPANIPTYVDDVFIGNMGYWWAWVDADGNLAPGEKWTNHQELPDWPGNVEAALSLCLEIAREQGDWALVITPDGDPECGEWWSAHFDVGPLSMRKHLVYADTPALALSLLALEALREKGGAE